jgi:hypothetical protein
MDVIERAAEHVPGYPGQRAASLPAPRPESAPAEGLAGLGDRELLAITGALPPGSGRAAAAREVLVGRYGYLVRSCARRYSAGPEPAGPGPPGPRGGRAAGPRPGPGARRG